MERRNVDNQQQNREKKIGNLSNPLKDQTSQASKDTSASSKDLDVNKKEHTDNTKSDKQTQTNKDTPSPTETKINNKEEKKEEKVITKPKVKRTEAVVNGRSLPVSTKHAIAICNFIKNKNIDIAIAELEQVEKKKKAVPMRGEIPHRKGKGMMSGRYPVKAAGEFIRLLKSLKSNAIVNELELEKCKLACMPNVAARQYRRFGRGRFKRTHVQLKLIPIKILKKSLSKTENREVGK